MASSASIASTSAFRRGPAKTHKKVSTKVRVGLGMEPSAGNRRSPLLFSSIIFVTFN